MPTTPRTFWQQMADKPRTHPFWQLISALRQGMMVCIAVVVAQLMSVNSFDFDVNGEAGITGKALGILAVMRFLGIVKNGPNEPNGDSV